MKQEQRYPWGKWLRQCFLPFKLPLGLGIVATIAVFGLWQQLLLQEQRSVQALVQQEADAVAKNLNRELATRIVALEWMASRWQVSSGTPRAVWEADATNYIEDLYGYQAIEWVDPSFNVQWVVPLKENASVQTLALSQEPRRRQTLDVARNLRQTLLTRTLLLAQGKKGFLACVPLFVKTSEGAIEAKRFDGFIVGTFQFQTFFDSALKASAKYKVQVYDSTDLIYSQGAIPPAMQAKTAIIHVYGTDWQIKVFPTSTFLAAGRSLLPTIVLWGGLAGIWTWAFALYLGQRSAQQSRRSKAVLDTSIDGIVTLDHQGNVLQASTSFAQRLGYSMEETLKLNVGDWDAQWSREELQQLLQGTAPVPPLFETRHRCKDGSLYDVEISYNRVDVNGAVMHFCICRDISDRKRIEADQRQAEAALRQSEATKEAIIQAIPDLMIRMRSDGSYVEFISNSSFTIVNPDQLRQNVTTHDVLPPALAALRMWHTQQALVSNTIQIYEHEILVEEKQCHEEVRIVPLPPDEVLVMVRDITDRKQAEVDLCHQKEMFQAIVNHIPVMISLFNAQGGIEFINPELERVLGWSLETWQQQDILAACCPDPAYRQSVLDHILAATGKWKDLVTLNATGQSLETTWANVRLSDGRFLGIGQDITERAQREAERQQKESALKQAMEAAETANVAKSMFLANMSHELRTPLNIILGFAQIMAYDADLTPTQQEDLQAIRRSGDHLLSLINDVLDLSKIEAGYAVIEETSFDLIALLRTLHTMMIEQAKAKHLQFECDIAPEVPQFVMADEQKLRQILLNLLSNAIKFTERGQVKLSAAIAPFDGSTVMHRTTEQGEQTDNSLPIRLQFEVTDTGIGIAPTDQLTIFDAFVQAEAGKQSINGTGLGLTISRKLLTLMQGEISVQSIPQVGSTFTVTLPAQIAAGMSMSSALSDRPVAGLAPGQPTHRILVVDDQPENRQVLMRLQTQLGLEVREAASGQEAIRLWQDWQPDLIWMDMRMPDFDGYEATKQIRALEQGQATIIIALTAQASQGDRTLALAAGCNDYMSKPFRAEILFLKLKEHLDLEYRYEEANTPSAGQFGQSSIAPAEATIHLDSSHFASLPEAWLLSLEKAAVCGNDGTIAELVAQLPPELTTLRTALLSFAGDYQFDQILQLIHDRSVPS